MGISVKEVIIGEYAQRTIASGSKRPLRHKCSVMITIICGWLAQTAWRTCNASTWVSTVDAIVRITPAYLEEKRGEILFCICLKQWRSTSTWELDKQLWQYLLHKSEEEHWEIRRINDYSLPVCIITELARWQWADFYASTRDHSVMNTVDERCALPPFGRI